MESLKKNDLIAIRDLEPEDYNFVYATWNKSYCFGNPSFRKIPQTDFYKYQSCVIRHLLTKPGVQKKVAVLKEDPDIILGYAFYEDDIAHYVFVKDDWRRIGIAKGLLPLGIQTITHSTIKLRKILEQKQKTLIFDPYQI